MAGLCAPLPTLRRRPHGRLRRLEVDVVSYSFIVSDLHRLLVAGLPAHCEKFWTTTLKKPTWPNMGPIPPLWKCTHWIVWGP